MAFEPIRMVAPDGRTFLAGSPTEREQLTNKGYKLATDREKPFAPFKDGEHQDHVHYAPESDNPPAPMPEPAKPALKSVASKAAPKTDK
ncbi:hypothetical protein [Nocardia farcinica]|uniref:Uncharacterized protein n=1 Tax=Nocardia farcinica (strain IFM 10152) TaxID=247156 RepID=Q5YSS6_NOCFA|nr:hypothetical protein [Nocardia farcinica]BAD58765.1 hypothetical protein NFA_39170 [Nocardia farcinica IFM 10152]